MQTTTKTNGGMTRPGMPIQPAAALPLTPKDVFAILSRHVLLIIILTMLGFMAGGASWYILRRYFPRYTAGTYIRVLPLVQTDPLEIGAVQPPKDIQYQHRDDMARLIKQQSTLQELLRRDKIRETRWYRSFGQIEDVRFMKAFKDLKSHLVAYAHRDASYVELSMPCRSAAEAALIVNEMAQLFVASQQSEKKAEVSGKLTSLEERRNWIEKDLAAADRALEDVRTKYGITDLEQPRGQYSKNSIVLRLENLEQQQDELSLEIKQTEADMENLKQLATGPVTAQIERLVESDPLMISLAQQLAYQETLLSGRRQRFGENHRVVRQTQQLVSEIKEKRNQRRQEVADQIRLAGLRNTQDRLVVMQERLAELQKLREEREAQKKELDQARVQYEQRMAIRDERQKTLDEIKQQIEKWRIILNDPETPKVQLVGLAPEPLEMVMSRHWMLWFPSGTMLGLVLGVCLAFLLETLNDLVRTPTDVGRYLNIPLLGIIPDISDDKLARKADPYHVVRQAPYSMVSESYRRLRTNLRLSGLTRSLKTVLIAGGDTGEGKTSVAVNLASTFVAEGKKVLLIDANFRRPSLKKLFPRTQPGNAKAAQFDFGLSSVLTNQCGCKDAVRPTGIEDLDVIDSGPIPLNPVELLAGARMKEMLSQCRKKYDHIIIDSAAVLLVSDAKGLTKLVNATILVFNAELTKRGSARRTINELRAVNAKVAGCVLFAAVPLKGGYFNERFRSYRRYLKPQLAAAQTF